MRSVIIHVLMKFDPDALKTSSSLNVVEGSCKGKKTCTVPANNNVFGDPCGGTYKYLEVSWKCVKGNSKGCL